MTAIHQLLAGVGPFDAVSEQARVWRRLFAEEGHEGRDFAVHIDPRVGGHFEPAERFAPGPDDLIVIRYSAWAAPLARALDLPQRKLVVYHNITPPEYLWNHSPALAVQCAVGRLQLGAFAAAATVAVGDSQFNADELRAAGAARAEVVPILVDERRYAGRGAVPESSGPLVVVVGRLAPNKRHDRVIDAFAAYRRACAPDARLMIVGDAVTPAYRALLERLAAESGAGQAITFTGPISQADVNAAYAAADVLLTLSEHEGFCIPLLEAFHFGVPVVARRAGAMPGVAGDAALWTDGDLALTAELIDLAVRDEALRSELVARGRRRLEEFSYERIADRVRAAVSEAL